MGLISLSSRFDPELQRIRDLAIPLARRVLVDSARSSENRESVLIRYARSRSPSVQRGGSPGGRSAGGSAGRHVAAASPRATLLLIIELVPGAVARVDRRPALALARRRLPRLSSTCSYSHKIIFRFVPSLLHGARGLTPGRSSGRSGLESLAAHSGA